MLSHDVLVALSDAAQAGFIAASSDCQCFPYHTFPGFKPGTAWITFTELDETSQSVTSGPAGLHGGTDIVLAKYRLQGANPTTAATNADALARTMQMRADKLIFASMFTAGANRNLGGLVLATGQTLHIASPRGGPYDVTNAIRSELTWECAITIKASLV